MHPESCSQARVHDLLQVLEFGGFVWRSQVSSVRSNASSSRLEKNLLKHLKTKFGLNTANGQTDSSLC